MIELLIVLIGLWSYPVISFIVIILTKKQLNKEKRNDCPLIVLALVVNVEGFIKYSAIYQGNMSDSRSLPDMTDKLRVATGDQSRRAIPCIAPASFVGFIS